MTLTEMATAASTDRNRAVDAYRALAMLAVALGHWLVIAVGTDADGEIVARNALEVAPHLAWLTWVFQVMPLFFVVGGFASAMSLDAHWSRGGADHDWVAGRLRRMVTPTALLAAVWLGIVALGTSAGAGGMVAAGAVGAAIPLWFLANYTIDTAFAPTVLRSLRRHRTGTLATLLVAFATVEILHLAGLPLIGHVNWVLGWMLFQVGGFLWRDSCLPTGRRLWASAAALWGAAVALVALGPWPMTMIHVSGVPFSPTHPPSLALVVFGAAFSATAIAVAPAVTAFLGRNRTAWMAVVAGNAVSMSVYLWHFTAAVAASAAFYALGVLPTATIGTGAWWLQKVPVVVASLIVLAPLVGFVSRVERRALLAPRPTRSRAPRAVVGLAALTSASLKLWSIGHVGGALVGMAGLVAVSVLLDRPSGVVA
ncbi:MAG: acyltransferase [Ilumatobacter sp.]|nr:acyltransferase [Ilumatobacter sp.]